MDTLLMKAIAYSANNQSRNKVIFHFNDCFGINTVDIGIKISERIFNFQEPSRIAMRVSSELSEILDASISNHKMIGKYLAIKNLGILLESELKIDFVRLIENYSQNNLLFVKWEGEIDSDNLYFLTKENGIKINIQNLSHIVI
jgi:hypothetical protein